MIKTSSVQEYKEASQNLKFIPLLEKCSCGEQVNITNEWIMIQPIPESAAGIDIDRTMINRCKKCGTQFLTEYNFAKTRWSVFGNQYFYLSDIDPKTRETITGKRLE